MRHNTVSDIVDKFLWSLDDNLKTLKNTVCEQSQKLTAICDELRRIKASLEMLHSNAVFHHESTEAIRDRVMEVSHTLDEVYPKPDFSPPAETAPLSERLIAVEEAEGGAQ